MSQQMYDVVVIGAGPGGYVASIRAAQLGLKVACVDNWCTGTGEPALGGTCLNVGCIPSKALLVSSERLEEAQNHLGVHGISVGQPKLDLAKMLARKDNIVQKMTKGIAFLFKKNQITWLTGQAKFVGSEEGSGYRIAVQPQSGNQAHDQVIYGANVVIATGSKPRMLPGLEVDNHWICDNEGALRFDSVPKRLGVIGAGVIGLELGSVWRRLGSEVTVFEASPQFLPAADTRVQKEALRLFAKQGLQLHFEAKLGAVVREGSQVKLSWGDGAGVVQQFVCDRLIVSVGRTPHTEGLGLDAIGLALDERGAIPVDEFCQTKLPKIWAIGDVVRGPMLAHKAEDEGVMVVERIAGQKSHINYGCIPWVVYTSPEIAWVGKTQQQLEQEGRAFRVGECPFMANGRALGMHQADGFTKIIADAQTDEILGVHILGVNASDLISEAALAMEFKAAAEDVARVCHPHPSLSEVIREAAMAACGQGALNM